MTTERETLLDSMTDGERQQVLQTLTGDGPELAQLLMALANHARSEGRLAAATGLLGAAVTFEERYDRGRKPLAIECLKILFDLEFERGEMFPAHQWARRMHDLAPDTTTRRTAARLMRKTDPSAAGARRRSSSGSHSVGGFELFVPEAVKPAIALADVGGLSAAKSTVYRYGILPMRDPDSAAHYGITRGGGLLLVGPPGCGKTLIAQAAAGEMGVPLYQVTGADLLHPLFGMAERAVVSAFETARANSPCVLFFDELDNVVPERRSDPYAAHRSLCNTMLSQLDGAKSNEGILIIGATNAPDLVDDAVKRPGRFDRVIHVGMPDSLARRAIWQVNLSKHPCADGIDTDLLVEYSEGLSGADIAGAVREAVEAVWVASADEGERRDVTMLDLLIALSRTRVDGAMKNRVEEAIAGMWGEMVG